MDWLKKTLGNKDRFSKTIKKIEKREEAEREFHNTPEIGKIATPSQRNRGIINQLENTNAKKLEPIREERKKQEKGQERLKLVIDGATLECSLCTQPKGTLKVNFDTPSTQEKRTATVVEKTAASLVFTGNCIKSPNSASSCASVMQTGSWKKTGLLKVQDQDPLLQQSTIPCLYGGTDIKITDSGQINEPEDIQTESAPVPNLEHELKIKILTKNFVPLGVPNFEGKTEVGTIVFEIQNKKAEVKGLVFKIKKGENILFTQNIEEIIPKKGKKSIVWDGFSSEQIYDSTWFVNGELSVEVSNEKVIAQKKIEANYKQVKWVDVKINNNTKKIEATLRVNLKDGGEIGKGNRKYSFADLESFVLEGMNRYWSRKKNRIRIVPSTDFVTINNLEYLVEIKSVNTEKNSMDDINLIYNHTSDWKRSSNPGSVTGVISFFGQLAPERVVYNSQSYNEEADFKLTSAHEIGHEIIKSFGGANYSYTHRGSSTLLTQRGKENLLPRTGEVNLMEYYSDVYYDLDRTIACEKDVLGILWNSKLKINQ